MGDGTAVRRSSAEAASTMKLQPRPVPSARRPKKALRQWMTPLRRAMPGARHIMKRYMCHGTVQFCIESKPES